MHFPRNVFHAADPPSPMHAVRTAVAAVVSLLVAGLLGLPEAYWASITALIVMQSTLGAALTISIQRFAGTAIGAFIGALLANWFGPNVFAFGGGVLAIGLLCGVLRMEKSGYRYASIALAIVMLIVRANSPWVIAAHRFLEVSAGIGVALALTAAWPEKQQVRRS